MDFFRIKKSKYRLKMFFLNPYKHLSNLPKRTVKASLEIKILKF